MWGHARTVEDKLRVGSGREGTRLRASTPVWLRMSETSADMCGQEQTGAARTDGADGSGHICVRLRTSVRMSETSADMRRQEQAGADRSRQEQAEQTLDRAILHILWGRRVKTCSDYG